VSWSVKMTPKAEKEFLAMCQSGELSREDLNIIRTWLNEMEDEGPEYIAKSKFWGDHELYDEWAGYRASCFSNPGRIIYRVKGNEIVVEVHRVTTVHDYRKGD
jgi:mRNA-degrading endonuclease YafQ of YafQ-DinJ toxin-antitoxin module